MLRYRDKDDEKLKKKIKNYNAKITRLKKKGYDPSLLPDKLSFKVEKERILKGSREDLNRDIKIYNAFLRKGSEKIYHSNRGLDIPKYEVDQIRLKLNKINKDRKKFKKKLEKEQITDRNIPIEGKFDMYSELNINKIRPKKFNWHNKSKEEFEKFKQGLKDYYLTEEQKKELYRNNFYKGMQNNLSPEQYKKLKEVLDKIDTDTLISKYYTDMNLQIDFFYEPMDQQLKFEEVFAAWNRISINNNQ